MPDQSKMEQLASLQHRLQSLASSLRNANAPAAPAAAIDQYLDESAVALLGGGLS